MLALTAAFLGWLFDGFEIGLFPVVARPALLSMLGPGGEGDVGLWMGRITAAFLIGAALGMAPVAAWIAIRGEALLANPADGVPALILGLAVTTWVAGFDIIYACQDAGFDESQGLHSIPARLGVPRALTLAAGLHVVTLAILAALPLVVPQLGAVYWGTLFAIAALLVWEHSLVRPDDLSRVNQAFFTANAAIGLLLLVAIAIDVAV